MAFLSKVMAIFFNNLPLKDYHRQKLEKFR